MPLSVTTLRMMLLPQVLEHRKGLALDHTILQLPAAQQLFRDWCTDGQLRLTNVVTDPKGLQAGGTVTLKGKTARPARVAFLTDQTEQVIGFRVTVHLPLDTAETWLPAGLKAALAFLRTTGLVGGVRLLFGVDSPGQGSPPVPGTGLAIELAVPGASPAPVLWGRNPGSGGTWALSGDFVPVKLPLDKAKGLVGDAGLELPAALAEAELWLDGAALTFDPGRKLLQSFWLGLSVRKSWELIPDGILTLHNVRAEFGVAASVREAKLSKSSRVQALVTGVLDVPGVTIGAELCRSGPRYELSAALEEPVSIKEALTKLFPEGTPAGLPDTARACALHGSFGGGTPSYSAEVAFADWQITDWLKLSHVDLSVGKAGTSVSASLDADWTVDGVTVAVHGEWTKSEDWWFTVHLQPTAREKALSGFGLSLPDSLGGLTLSYLGAGVTKSKSAGEAQLTAQGAIPGLKLAFGIRATVNKTLRTEDGALPGAAFQLAGQATLRVGERLVKLTVTGSGDRFDGTWTGSPGIGAADLLTALGVSASELPTAILPDLTSLTVSHGKKGRWLVTAGTAQGHALTLVGGKGWWFAQVRIACAARLSSLELLRGQLPAGQDLGVGAPTVRWAKTKVPGTEISAWRAWYGTAQADALGVTEGEVPAGVGGAVRLLVGAQWQDLPLRTGAPKALTTGSATPSADLPVPAAPGAGAELSAELQLGRSIGPLRVRGVEIRLGAETVTIGVHATLTIAGVELQAEGLGVSVGLAAPHTVRPALRGLLLAVRAGAAEVAGALLYSKPPPASGFTDQFDGMLLLRLPTVSGGLLGQLAYRTGGGAWSFSAFGELAAEGGGGFGPPPFRVTGAMLGGGYNATVRVPAPDEVDKFPLVAGLGGAALRGQSPAEMAKGLIGAGWLSPKLGQNWVAVGIQFTSFEFLAGRALALVEFGDDLTVGLFALVRASFPTRRKADDPVYAQAEIGIRALYQRGPGLLSFTALLTENSYVFDPSFKLTGGLAVYVWSPPEPGKGPDRSGDFAITLGGYHPLYEVPGHYPRVPRLGASWAVSRAVAISASAYLAITPGALMLGARTSVTFDGGWVRAWFAASFDGYLQWTNPPRYDFRIGVRVGCEASVSVGPIHFTVRAEVSADCHVWGEPFGGTASVSAGPVSFTVPFGSTGADDREVAWADFQRQLPPPVKATVVSGLLPARPKQGSGPPPWAVAGDGFAFTVHGTAPATRLLLGLPGGGEEEVRSTPEKVTIRPLKETAVTSEFKVTVAKDGTPLKVREDGWTVTAETGSVPEALWGKPGEISGHLLTGRLTGLRLTAPSRDAGRSPGVITPAALHHETVTNTVKLPFLAGVHGPRPVRATDAVGKVAAIGGEPAVAARGALLDALRKAGAEAMARDEGKPLTEPPVPLVNNRLTRYVRDVESAFTDAPLTVTES